MTLYVIFLPEGTERVESGFPDAFREVLIPDQLWIIGSDLLTAADVCQALKMEPGSGGVVVKFEEYYGMWSRALWDKLRAWGG